MKNSKLPLTGIAEASDKKYVFYFDEYSVKFMENEVSLYSSSVIKTVDGFVKGQTHSGYEILFYTGQREICVFNTTNMPISSYVISRSNVFSYDLLFFDNIVFVGGTLSRVKSPNKLQLIYDEEHGEQINQHLDDKQSFSFSTDEFTCNCLICSSVGKSFGVEGNTITNDKIMFKMSFDKKQNLSSVYRHYNKFLEILSFLTNRKNVAVDEIYLEQNEVLIGESMMPQTIARVFIRQDKEQTRKKIFYNLEFESMGCSVGKLFELFYKTKDRKPSYSLGFHPQSDEQSMLISNETVRLVCSALECEISFIDCIVNEEKDKINNLKKQIQHIIDAHKISPDKLKDKTYSLIESSMNHWSSAAADQFKMLFHMYEEEMLLANNTHMRIGDAEIDAFVKYRNDITHGSYRVMNLTIACTAYLMECLVYCCILTRIGIRRDVIREWFREGRLLS